WPRSPLRSAYNASTVAWTAVSSFVGTQPPWLTALSHACANLLRTSASHAISPPTAALTAFAAHCDKPWIVLATALDWAAAHAWAGVALYAAGAQAAVRSAAIPSAMRLTELRIVHLRLACHSVRHDTHGSLLPTDRPPCGGQVLKVPSSSSQAVPP